MSEQTQKFGSTGAGAAQKGGRGGSVQVLGQGEPNKVNKPGSSK